MNSAGKFSRRGSGLLPTPRAQDSYERSNLKTVIKANGGQAQMTLSRKIRGLGLLPKPRAEKQSPQSRTDFTPNLAYRIESLSSPISEILTEPNGKEQLYLPGEFHVSQHPLPGSGEERRMTVGSGRKLLESWPKSSQPGGSLKTLVESLVLSKAWYSRICYLRWKAKVMKSGRLLFQLAPSMPRTEGTGSGLLGMPVSQGGPRYKAASLQVQTAMFPTPREFAYKDAKKDRQKSNLEEVVGISHGLRLQPAFAEWMIGFPPGFTHIEFQGSRHSATPSSRKSHTKSSRGLRK